MVKKFYELRGWEVSIRFWRCKCLEDETFFIRTLLKLCHCKRVYASKQGDSSKPRPVFLRHWMQMEDLKYQKKGSSGQKDSSRRKSLGHWIQWTHEVNSTEKSPWRGEFLSRKVQLQNLGSYEVQVIFHTFTIEFRFCLLYFALF